MSEAKSDLIPLLAVFNDKLEEHANYLYADSNHKNVSEEESKTLRLRANILYDLSRVIDAFIQGH